MITIQVKNIEGISLPKQATDKSAGYDIVAISEPKIVGEKLEDKYFLPTEPKIEWWKYVSYIEYETGLYIAPSDETIHTLIYPRSSISNKTNLMLGNSIGLVDFDYRGQLLCRFRYIWQPFDMSWLSVKDNSDVNNPYISMTLGNVNPERIYKKGDTIAQLVFSSTIQVNFQLVPELDQTKRGSGGFGSTDSPQKTLGELKTYTENVFGLADAYQKAGGVSVKKRYVDEIKDRERQILSKPSTLSSNTILSTGIRERQP